MAEPAQNDIERWRGGVTSDLQYLRQDVATFRAEMTREHSLLARRIDEFELRLKPLERLQYFVYGAFVVLIVIAPIVWTYTQKFNDVLRVLQQVSAPKAEDKATAAGSPSK